MTLTLFQVPRLVFGPEAFDSAVEYLGQLGADRPFVVATPVHGSLAARLHPRATVDCTTDAEPTVAHFEKLLAAARAAGADAVVGLGGGSVLDVAKLVAALLRSSQTVADSFGIGRLKPRATPLLCLPTTAGTGSEVSPNALLLDEIDASKKAVISPSLVPDAAFIDPSLMLTVPAQVTAGTGIDALTHCIEAFINVNAHPMINTWALDGIRHIAAHLVTAIRDPQNLQARTHLALGSLYGGLCLGPVNTAAVHALSYPLGSRFHIAHGHSNAALLPHVVRFNIAAVPDRYAAIALALGAEKRQDATATAHAGLRKLWELIDNTGLEMRLSALGIPREELPRLAAEGLAVTRLMKNNPRSMTQQDAESIYRAAFDAMHELP